MVLIEGCSAACKYAILGPGLQLFNIVGFDVVSHFQVGASSRQPNRPRGVLEHGVAAWVKAPARQVPPNPRVEVSQYSARLRGKILLLLRKMHYNLFW
jgi:hypothetical protein